VLPDPRHNSIGKYSGTILFIVVGVLLWGVSPVARTALGILVLVTSAAVLVS